MQVTPVLLSWLDRLELPVEMGSQDEPTCPLPGLAQDNADACNSS